MLIYSVGCSAQFNFGIAVGGGINIASVSGKDKKKKIETPKMNHQLGFFMRYDLAKYYFQLSPAYLNKGSVRLYDANAEWKSLSITRFTLPLTFGIHFMSGLRLYVGTGFEFAFWENQDIEIDATTASLFGYTGKAYFENEEVVAYLQAGLGMDLGKLYLGLNYQKQFLSDSNFDQDEGYEIELSMINLILAYTLEL